MFVSVIRNKLGVFLKGRIDDMSSDDLTTIQVALLDRLKQQEANLEFYLNLKEESNEKTIKELREDIIYTKELILKVSKNRNTIYVNLCDSEKSFDELLEVDRFNP